MITRESWLDKAVSLISKNLFAKRGYKVPNVRVSVGFPYGSRGSKAIGQHWAPEASIDKRGSIFISPSQANGLEVLSILTHELVHAVVGNKVGHGPEFKKCALDVGLEGKMRSTTAGPELESLLGVILKRLGKYPHAKLEPGHGPVKKQTTRMIKMECFDCDYKVRASLTAITTHGAVICPCGEEMQVEVP